MGQTRPLRHRLLLLFGSLGPLGHAPASGTVSVAVAGIPLVVLGGLYLSVPLYLAATVGLGLVSVLVHDVGDRLLGEKDSRKLVLDELVGFAVAMIGVSITWQLILIGFLVERALDIAKVPPANVVERRVPGGWGVVGDDVVAGLYTLGLLHALQAWLPTWMGVG